MAQNLVEELESLTGYEASTAFVSALDSYLQNYLKEGKDLDELTKQWDFGLLLERSPRKPGYIVKRRFKLSEAAERGKRVCGLEEMTQRGVFGKRQKRNPQCEQVGKLYQLAVANWLALRMKEPRAGGTDVRDWDQWFQKEAQDTFNHLPEEAVSHESESGASKRRKTAAADLEDEAAESLLMLTANASSSGVVSTLVYAGENTQALTDASVADTTLGTATSAERESKSTYTEIDPTGTGTTRIPTEISLAHSETTTSSRSEN